VHFIETVFGVSPDGGDGSSEMMLLMVAVPVAVALLAAFIWRRKLP
jgi:hypothetical protein